jgi:molecular chaperone GrpE
MPEETGSGQEEVDAILETGEPVPHGEDAPGAVSAEGEEEDGRVRQLEAELAELKDRYLRAMADMDNVRRRTEREKEDARKFANEGLLSDLLPVLDNFARALEAAAQTTDFESLKSGVDQIQRQFADVLDRAGLQRIEAVGQAFDPNLHEAIMQVEPQDEQGPHEVVQELRAGYKLNDRVLRPTLVKVTSG